MLLYEFLEGPALQYENNVALVYEEKSITYKNLFEKVADLSNAILQSAKDEQFIGISTTRSIEMIAGVLAILKAGKTYLPLDPNYPTSRLQQMIDDSKIKYTVCVGDENNFFNGFGLISIASDQQHNLAAIDVPFQSPIVCVLYTSGSTGKPKGVCLGHQGLINQLIWQKQNGYAKPGVKTLLFSHLSFDAAFLEIFVPVYTGGTLYIANDSYRYNSGYLLRYINEKKITRLFLPYTVVQFLSEIAQQYNLYPSSIKEIITGGELLRITPQIANFFNTLSDCTLMNVYGPTETSVWVTELKLKGNALNWPPIPPIGNLAAGARIFLVDQNLQPVKHGEIGEILIYGDCVALYYLNKPEQTAERFIQWQHPELGEIRVYRTGDLASLNEDDSFQFHGRRDEQVKIRGGYRVELGEIEVVICNINGLSQAKVIVREDVPGQRKIVAYVILSDESIKEADIKKHVAEQLPGYMVPDLVVIMKEFPLTVSGKIDKLLLPAPQKSSSVNKNIFKSPANPLEDYLKLLWEEILQIKNISTNANFFDLGGNSLIAIQMMIRIEKEKEIQLPLVSVFDHYSIEKLAMFINNYETPEEASSLIAIKPSGSRPPVYLIHGDSLNVLNFSGLARHIHPDQPVYGLQPKAIDGKSEIFDTIEAISQHYIEAIIQQNPTGPYAIAGHSFGGYVAFEMIKQLKQSGKPILMLGLFDTDVFNAENDLSFGKRITKKILRQFPKFLWIAKSFIANPKHVINYQFVSLRRRFREFFHLHTTAVAPGTEPYYHLMDKINAIHHKALYNYRLEKCTEKIVLFKAIERPYFVDDFDFLGWQKYAMNGLDVYHIPGDHVTMFTEPNCKILAKEIETALLKAQK